MIFFHLNQYSKFKIAFKRNLSYLTMLFLSNVKLKCSRGLNINLTMRASGFIFVIQILKRMTNTDRHITKSYHEAYKTNGNFAAALVPINLPLDVIIIGIIISLLGIIILG
jgi:hypothetical protein